MRLKKKTGLILVVAIAVMMLFAACAPTESPEPGKNQPDTETKAPGDGQKYNIGVSWQGANNDWASMVLYHFNYGFDVKYADKVENVYINACDMDDTKQIADVEDLLVKGIDILLIQPVSESSLANVIEKVKDNGIPVVVFGASAGTDKYDTYINRDGYMTGYKYTQWMGERLEGKGNVIVIMGWPGSGYSNDVLRGVEDALADYPEMEVLGTEYALYTPATSKQIVESYMAKGVTIDGVIVDGGLMNFGVIEAFLDADMPIPPTTGDDSTGFLKKVRDLGYTDFVSQSGGAELAIDAVDAVFSILAGEEVPKDDVREPMYVEGAEIIAMIKDEMPDSYWLACQIPEEELGNYYSIEK